MAKNKNKKEEKAKQSDQKPEKKAEIIKKEKPKEEFKKEEIKPIVEPIKAEEKPTSKSTDTGKGKDYDPLEGAVKEDEGYTPINTGDMMPEIPEPPLIITPIQPITPESEPETKTSEPLPLGGDQLTDASLADKTKAAEMLVDLALKGYDKLHALGRWYVIVSDEEFETLTAKGELDAEMEVPYDEKGNIMTVAEFVKDFNSQVKAGLTLDQEWIERVRVPMIRICIRRGWGLTDEQFVIYSFAEDAATKLAMVYGFKKSMNICMKAFVENNKRQSGTLEQTDSVQPDEPEKQGDDDISDAIVVDEEISEPEEKQ